MCFPYFLEICVTFQLIANVTQLGLQVIQLIDYKEYN